MAGEHGRLRRALSTVREYSRLSTLHGLRHVVKEATSIHDRVFWLLLVVAGSVLLGSVVMDQLHHYSVRATATELIDPSRSVREDGFPCVALCPNHQVDRAIGLQLLRLERDYSRKALFNGNRTSLEQEAFGLERLLPHLGDEELRGVLLGLQMLSDPGLAVAAPFLEERKATLIALDTVNVVDFMRRVLPACGTFFQSCLWRGTPFDCCKHFRVEPTELGFCYFFDAAAAERTVCLEAFPGNDDLREECLLTQNLSYFGPGSGLRVFLEAQGDVEISAAAGMENSLARVTIDEQCSATTMSVEGVVYGVRGGAYSLALSSTRMRMAPSLQQLPMSSRKCLTPEEWPGSTPVNRRNFPSEYSELECLVRCRRRLLLETCGCVAYPLTLGDPNIVCMLSKTSECISNTSDWIRSGRPAAVHANSSMKSSNGHDCAHCLPGCESASFAVDARVPSRRGYTDHPDSPLVPRTMLDIFYEGPNSAMVYLTSPVISFGRLMSTFGAAANLFLGMSYLTLLEFHVLIGKCIWIFIIRNRY